MTNDPDASRIVLRLISRPLVLRVTMVLPSSACGKRDPDLVDAVGLSRVFVVIGADVVIDAGVVIGIFRIC